MGPGRGCLSLIRRLALLASVAVAIGVSSGCATYVPLNQARYNPELDLSRLASYRGRAILMRGFENVDENTTIFTYPRSGPRRYGGPALTSYFWYCFRTAFTRLGVRVFEEGQGAGPVPVMDLRLVRLDESDFTVDVTLLGVGSQGPFQKRFSIRSPAPTALDKTSLEDRAYRMVSFLFQTIVSDPGFEAVVVGQP